MFKNKKEGDRKYVERVKGRVLSEDSGSANGMKDKKKKPKPKTI